MTAPRAIVGAWTLERAKKGPQQGLRQDKSSAALVYLHFPILWSFTYHNLLCSDDDQVDFGDVSYTRGDDGDLFVKLSPSDDIKDDIRVSQQFSRSSMKPVTCPKVLFFEDFIVTIEDEDGDKTSVILPKDGKTDPFVKIPRSSEDGDPKKITVMVIDNDGNLVPPKSAEKSNLQAEM